MVPCLPGHLPAGFMSLWSLGFLRSLGLAWSAVHSYMPPWSLVSPMPCLVSSIVLACASVVSWSHMCGHVYACMVSYGFACIPGLLRVRGLVYVSLVTYALS